MGVFGHPHAAELTYLGLFALQHRGQESAGIVSIRRQRPASTCAAWGWWPTFSAIIPSSMQLAGNCAIGHVRYSTAGGSTAANVQPLVVRTKDGLWRWPTTAIW